MIKFRPGKYSQFAIITESLTFVKEEITENGFIQKQYEFNDVITSYDYNNPNDLQNDLNMHLKKIENGQVVNTSEKERQQWKEDKKAEDKNKLRMRRSDACFSVVNRGQVWYDMLSEEQKHELKVWYKAWLDVTGTMVEPVLPAWLK